MNHTQQVRFLYKTILRLHRSLPCELQQLGDQYVKDEFRRHKTVAIEHVHPFMLEWTNYCGMLANQVGLRGVKTAKPLGRSLDPDELELFEGQQLYQLFELRQSISPIDKNSSENNESARPSSSSESNVTNSKS